jgi:hypothetical protein
VCKGLYFLPIKDEFTKRIHSPSFCCRYRSSSRSPEKKSTSGYCFVVALCGVICGADNWVEIEEYGRAKPVDAVNNVHRTHCSRLMRFVNSPHLLTLNDSFLICSCHTLKNLNFSYWPIIPLQYELKVENTAVRLDQNNRPGL